MSQLTNLVPASSYGDLLTTTNNGQGLTTVLTNLQDGLGNNSTVQIATTAINFSRSGPNTFQLDGISLISVVTDINNICKPNPILPGVGGVVLPSGTTAQRPNPATDGTLRFNTDSHILEFSFGNAWTSSGFGDVIGPNASVSGNIAIFDSNTGNSISDSGVHIDAVVPPQPLNRFNSFFSTPRPLAPQVDVLQLSNIGVLAFDDELATSGVGNIVVGTEQILNLFVQPTTFLRNAVFTDGVDTAPTSFSALVELSSTTGALLLSRMTTVERDALDAVNGMFIYNTTTHQVNAYVNGAWTAGTGGGSPTTSTYILNTADANLPSAQSLGTLPTGLLKNNLSGSTGTLSTSIAGTDYYAPGFPTHILDTFGGNSNFGIGSPTPNNTGLFNTFIGLNVAQSSNSSSTSNVGIGFSVLSGLTSGTNNTAIGIIALPTLTTGNDCTAIGANSLNGNMGNQNTAIGSQSGYHTISHTACSFLGFMSDVDQSAGTFSNATAIGANSVVSIGNSVVLGNSCNVGIGLSNPTFPLDIANVNNQAAIRFVNSTSTPNSPGANHGNLYLSGGNLFFMNSSSISIPIATPNNATYILKSANSALPDSQSIGALTTGLMKNNVSSSIGTVSTAVAGTDYYSPGFPAFIEVNTVNNSFYIGNASGNNAGTFDTLVGFNVALNNNTFSFANTGLGSSALLNMVSGIDNTAIGRNSLGNTISGQANTAVGSFSLFQALGNNNTAFGAGAADNFVNYDSCTFIGSDADASVDHLTNSGAIGANSLVGVSNAISIGNGCYVGIGNNSPAYTLDLGNIANQCAIQLVNSNNTPTTPAANHGVLYLSSGNLFFLNSSGTSIPIVTPNTATFIVQTASASLPDAQSLGSLTTGLLKNTVTGSTGILSKAAAGTDYYSPGNPTTITDSAGSANNFSIGTNSSPNAGGLNTFVGIGAGQNTNNSSSNNASLGYNSLNSLTGGVNCTAVGANALASNTANGVTAFGNGAGSAFSNNTSCTFIGNLTSSSANNLSNSTAIGANASFSASNCIVLGNGCNVGIGISNPSYNLHISNISNVAAIGLHDTTNTPSTPSLGIAVYSSGGDLWVIHPDSSTTQVTGYTDTTNPNVVEFTKPIQVTGSVPLTNNYAFYALSGTSPSTGYAAGGSGNYGLYTTFRLLASEFDATSSKKIKDIICPVSDIEDELIESFLKIPFFKYQYKDKVRDGNADCYGVIAEYLEGVFPGYVSNSQQQFVPNILKFGKVSKFGSEKGVYSIELEENIPQLEGTRLQVLLETDEQIEVDIFDSIGKLLIVKTERALPEKLLVYGTYETCPVVSKPRLFEIGLVILQGLIKKLLDKGVL
jgi:hypothetical protein